MIKGLVRLLAVLMYTSIAVAETNTTSHPEPFGIPDWFKNSFLDLSEDNAEAADEGKHLLVLFTQDFCPYCQALIEKNLTQKKIRESLDANFDIVHLNMWGDREVFDIHGEATTEKAIAKTLKVQFTPTLIFFDESGQPALRTNGYLSSTEMLASLEYVSTKEYQKRSILDFLRDSPRASARESLGSQPFFQQSFDDYQVGSPIALVFEQTDCVDCDTLHECVFAKDSFREQAELFHIVQLDLWSTKTIALPDGRSIPVNRLAQELKISYTPTVVIFNPDFSEVIRAEAQLRSFHVESLFEYVSGGVYATEPQFQRFIDTRADKFREQGKPVSILGTDENCKEL